MDMFADFTARLTDLVLKGNADAALDEATLSRIAVELPRDPAHGDLASNVAMVLAKPLQTNPRVLAEELAEAFGQDPDVAHVEVAGPGFLNFRLKPHYWHRILSAVLAAGEGWGRSDGGGGKLVNVEYVSANPTGPMHVGHCRGAVVGDAIANLLDATGHAVTREYYMNDAGVQVDTLARSAFLRYREACGEEIGPIPEGLYPGDYLVPVGQRLKQEFGTDLLDQSESDWLPDVRDAAIDAMIGLIRDDLAALGIHHDVFFSERSLIQGDDRVADAIADLRARDLVYEGRLPPPKGQLPEDWEDRQQTLFRSTAFGDDIDRPLIKSDGSYTYFASDIAYHRDKYLRGFNRMIDVWGADHGGYIKRMTSAVKAVSAEEAALQIRLCQLVKLFRDGEPVRMSKRAGDFVTLREVVEEVGADAVRFMMLTRKSDAPLDFDFAKVVEQSRDNPVFYVQYAHARIRSVFRQAEEVFPGMGETVTGFGSEDFGSITDAADLALVARVACFPNLVENAAIQGEPHRVAFYLQDLAASFHALWNKGKDTPQLRFIQENQENMTRERLAFIDAVGRTIAAGLRLLGVEPVDALH
jgi:arginyl-tRNA synthetase